MDFFVVYLTAPDEESAASIARALVDERLAGCVNIVRGIRSIYSWQGKTADDTEVLMICKTRTALFDSLSVRVKQLHPYTVPEIIAMPVVAGSDDYLKWLEDVTT